MILGNNIVTCALKLIEASDASNERCLVLGHSMQTNERHNSFSDRRKANGVMEKLKN